MKVAFILSMPHVASWNGKWSGENDLHAKVINVGVSKKAKEKYTKLVGSYHYSWSDGWGACVDVKIVETKEATQLKKNSHGFCGYDWMIDSIRLHGEIKDNVK